jgi:hypothetical protein
MQNSYFIEVESVHFDCHQKHSPTKLERSPKMFYVKLRQHPPKEISKGSVVKLHTSKTKSEKYYVDDIIGNKLILIPFKGSEWNIPYRIKNECLTFETGYDISPGSTFLEYSRDHCKRIKSKPIRIPY